MNEATTTSIRCGHCKQTHSSVDDVRACAAYESEPTEICCWSCDAVKGYAETPAEAAAISTRRCGCDSNDAVYWEVMYDEERAAQSSLAFA